MKIYTFRGEMPNFGDELNNWLLPKVFPNLFDDDDSRLFLGIGSILYDHHPPRSEKIVFGSGYGAYTPIPNFDDTWKVYCVRGPRTADACRLGREKVAGDAAILINSFRSPPRKKSIRRSFIPHWQSVDRGHWELACQRAGVHFIDPRHPVEDVLAAIETSAVVIAEAMHGAIVADALRIPWVPVLPFHSSHWMKWHDWAEALDMTLLHHRIWPSSTLEAWISRSWRGGRRLKNPRGPLKAGVRTLDWAFVRLAALGLSRAAESEPMLSSERALARAINRLETNADQIMRDYSGH